MEKVVHWETFQKATSEDFNEAQGFIRESIDHVVSDGISDERGFVGFDVTKKSATVLNVANGRFYTQGKVYFRDDDGGLDFDLIRELPAVAKRIVTMVVAGPPASDVKRENREFLTNVVTRTSIARDTATENWRLSLVSYIGGNESATPIALPPEANLYPFAYVTLNPNGIESITMIDDNRLKSVRDAYELAEAVSGEVEEIKPQLITLGSDIARVAKEVTTKTDWDYTIRLAGDMARAKAKLNLPDLYNDYGADFFLDSAESDPAFSGSNRLIEDGLRFPNAAVSAETPLTIVNPADAHIKISNGLILPAYDVVRWREPLEPSGEHALNQFTFVTMPLKIGKMAPKRWRFGKWYLVSMSSAWWKTGRWIDPAKFIFVRDGETYEVEWDGKTDPWKTKQVRFRRIWVDECEDTHWWGVIDPPQSFGGFPWANDFLCTQDMWLVEVGLPFSRLDASGPVTIWLSEVTDDGVPNNDRVIETVTVPYEQLVRVPKWPWVTIARHAFPATLLRAGKRYAISFTTSGNHWVWWIPPGQLFHGHAWYRDNVGKWVLFPDRQLWMELGIAQFRYSRVEVPFSTQSLGGGIQKIDVRAAAVEPPATSIVWQVQVGGIWREFREEELLGPLNTIPSDVPIRAVMIGTRSLMPALHTTGATVQVSRCGPDLREVSVARTLAATSTKIEVRVQLEYFDEPTQDCVLKVISGGTTYLPSTTSDRSLGNGIIERRANWTIPGTTSIRTVVEGHLNDINSPFVVGALTYVATP